MKKILFIAAILYFCNGAISNAQDILVTKKGEIIKGAIIDTASWHKRLMYIPENDSTTYFIWAKELAYIYKGDENKYHGTDIFGKWQPLKGREYTLQPTYRHTLKLDITVLPLNLSKANDYLYSYDDKALDKEGNYTGERPISVYPVSLKYLYYTKKGFGVGVFGDAHIRFRKPDMDVFYAIGPALSYRMFDQVHYRYLVVGASFPLFFSYPGISFKENPSNMLVYDISVGMEHFFKPDNRYAFSWSLHFTTYNTISISVGITFGL